MTFDEQEDTLSRAGSRRSRTPRSPKGEREREHGERLDPNRTKVSGRSKKPAPTSTRERPPVERHFTDSFYADETTLPTRPKTRFEQDLFGDPDPRKASIVRRQTTPAREAVPSSPRPKSARSHSLDDIDMDLAYGELPPPLPSPARTFQDKEELKEKMSKLTLLLDEANALQHSATAIIEHLQKNPDALAAVALTLAEISNLASKMAPGVLMSMKGAFPAVIALLMSPQFMIAAGVGIGVTVVALGGYKIIKKIQAKKDAERELEEPMVMEELIKDTPELSRIEMWRKGVADSEATSVEGEFVTPLAGRRLLETGELTEANFKAMDEEEGKKDKKAKSRSKDAKVKVPKSAKSSSSKTGRPKAKKEPSPLKMLFKKQAA